MPQEEILHNAHILMFCGNEEMDANLGTDKDDIIVII